MSLLGSEKQQLGMQKQVIKSLPIACLTELVGQPITYIVCIK